MTSAFLLAQIIGPERFNDNGQLLGSLGRRQRRDRGSRGMASLAPVPRADHGRGRRCSGAGIFLAIVIAIIQPGDGESAKNIILGFVLLLGIGVFLFAMWWDASDRARTTRRSDVAFWLHLLAAPMIAHPIFTLLGLSNGSVEHRRGADRGWPLRRCSA